MDYWANNMVIVGIPLLYMSENLDALGFREGHHTRGEFERLLNDFYMDDKHPDRQLLRTSQSEFQFMVHDFAMQIGPKFWGAADRSHLTPTALTWSNGRRLDDSALV